MVTFAGPPWEDDRPMSVARATDEVTSRASLSSARTAPCAPHATRRPGEPLEIPAGYSVQGVAGLQAQGSRQGK